MQTVFVDESGYTGGHLLDKSQPFQSLSAICINEEDASSLIEKYFPSYQGAELKYKQMKRKKSYWNSLLQLQSELLNNYNGISYVTSKKYMQLLLFLDDCYEPYVHSIGENYYKDGLNFATASMLYYCAPAFWGQKEFDELLFYYQKSSTTSMDLYVNVLVEHAKKIVATGTECSEFLKPLAYRDKSVIDSLFFRGQRNDISFPMLIGLIGRIEDDMNSSYIIKHDNSGNMKNYRLLLDTLINLECDMELFYSVHNTMKYPLKVSKVEECDSKSSKGVQLVDILAGGIIESTMVLCGIKEKNKYNQQIIGLYGDRNIIHQFPTQDPNDIVKQYKKTDAEKAIDFFAKNIKL